MLRDIAKRHRQLGKDLTPDEFVKKKAYEEAQICIIKSLEGLSESEKTFIHIEFIPLYLVEQLKPSFK